LTLGEFRRRLVSALVAEEPAGPPPRRPTDTEAIQLHLGVRYLLLAPLYGYSLQQLKLGGNESLVLLLHDGVEEEHPLEAFRQRIRAHVRAELQRVARGAGRGAIDLSRVAEAEQAAQAGDHAKVIDLLGPWPAPLTIFLRTPEGQMLNPDTRGLIAKGLGLLGSACVELGDVAQGEEILRLAVQYAGDGPLAPDIYSRLGLAILRDGRPGEAIASLRRAANLGASGDRVWPLLARAFLERGRCVAAFGAMLEAQAAGVDRQKIQEIEGQIEARLGSSLKAWRHLVSEPAFVAP
jgi:tetratricopeptide (TPR) repeat protein